MGGRYASHIRSEDREFWTAIDEAIEVGRAAKRPVQISHVKLAMRSLCQADGDIGIVATSMSEADVVALAQWPFANFCSDGMSTGGDPRGFGAFPRVLGRYVREQKVLRLEDAIRRMTSLAADNIGLRERGLVKPGYFADLVLFDDGRIIDRATTAAPTASSHGIHTVIVNGRVVFRDGKSTQTYGGRILRRP